MNSLDAVYAEHGVATRGLRQVISLLVSGWYSLDELIRGSATPRRSVEELLAAIAGDLDHDGTTMRVKPEAAPGYQRYAARTRPSEPLDFPEHPDALRELRAYLDDVPPARADLDHVQASAETVLRRASWLKHTYDLALHHIVLLGDHDLTALAIRIVEPEAQVTVVDVDDRVLAYLDQHSAGAIRTVHADLRIGMPPALRGSADLVFSDPPYTPDGMALFAARGIECLAEPARGRLLLAYGYSDRHPSLGLDVQRRLGDLGLVFEAVLPDFHAYHGAQAIGSAADMYVCRPTARPRGKTSIGGAGIYTHGSRSVESTGSPANAVHALHEVAGDAGAWPVRQPRADWAKPIGAAPGTALALDLGGDPGPLLVRALFAANAARVAVLVPNAHADLANAAAQAALSELLRDKYRLRLLRNNPDRRHAIVLAEAAAEPDPVAGAICARAHGKVLNTWREALITASGGTLSKNAAREFIARQTSEVTELRLIDLPRHRLAEVLAAARDGAKPASRT